MIREYVVKVTDALVPDAFKRFESEWSPEQEIVRCKDCKHRPKKPESKTYGSGFDLEFPEGSKCPCRCSDEWYSWYPKDDWFCADGERR